MCGFAGFAGGRLGAAEAEGCLWAMGERIRHRGPDAGDIWFDAVARVGLSHRRLAIIDLSPAGAQPMRSASGRYVIAFNGEVYNFGLLRDELQGLGHAFRGHSDTEVMLAAFEQWGVEPALQRFVGMFAFALWDCRERQLYLARDRMGEKPLYYGLCGGALLFGSELKALQAHPGWRGELNRDAIALLLRHNYIPAPHSVWRGIHKLLPGSYLRVDMAGDTPQPGEPVRYWDAAAAFRAGPLPAESPEARLEAFEALLRDAVRQQMVADVPLGAFLSGGIDSSTVVALMQAQSTAPVRTFSIGFHEQGFDEAVHAKAVAAHLGTEHTELYVTPDQALALIPRLPELYDEPFADSSQMPTTLVAQMTRRHVTVALSGDGGDELFCGYSRYFSVVARWRQLQAGRRSLRGRLRQAALLLPPSLAARLARRLVPGQAALSLETIAGKLRREALLRQARDLPEFYRHAISYQDEPAALVIGAREPQSLLCAATVQGVDDPYHQLMLLDVLSYLPDDILAKVDRAGMGCSLESRIPFLDHRVVEYAARIPVQEQIDARGGKALLRQVLYRHVPPELVDRPKQGFAVPVAAWLRGPLRDWAQALLEEGRLRREGVFRPEPLLRLWREHQEGGVDHSFRLWGVLMFQAWYEQVQP